MFQRDGVFFVFRSESERIITFTLETTASSRKCYPEVIVANPEPTICTQYPLDSQSSMCPAAQNNDLLVRSQFKPQMFPEDCVELFCSNALCLAVTLESNLWGVDLLCHKSHCRQCFLCQRETRRRWGLLSPLLNPSHVPSNSLISQSNRFLNSQNTRNCCA